MQSSSSSPQSSSSPVSSPRIVRHAVASPSSLPVSPPLLLSAPSSPGTDNNNMRWRRRLQISINSNNNNHNNHIPRFWRTLVLCGAACTVVYFQLASHFYVLDNNYYVHQDGSSSNGYEYADILNAVLLPERSTTTSTTNQRPGGDGITHDTKTRATTAKNTTSPFAYAFVIGGCDPQVEPSYQNYLYNILIAARILKERGSTLDVLALFQISAKVPENQKKLPAKDIRLLHALGVYVYYIPQQTTGQESFYRTQLDKFRILGLTQYQRVLFMDGDVMPTANLDYLFDFSWNGTLKENVVIQGVYEPFNGGFFMLETGHLPQVQEIIAWRERTGARMRYPYYDPVVGWGQVLTPEDPWRSSHEQGTNWTFLAAFADQGLLYYYTKYARQSVSVIQRFDTVKNWAAVPQTLPNGTEVMVMQVERVLDNPFAEASKASNNIALPGKHNHGPPMDSFIHFTGSFKPWLRGGPPPAAERTEAHMYASGKHYWFWKLQELNQELDMGLDFDTHWATGKQRPPLGMYPLYGHVLNASSNLLTPLERDYPDET